MFTTTPSSYPVDERPLPHDWIKVAIPRPNVEVPQYGARTLVLIFNDRDDRDIAWGALSPSRICLPPPLYHWLGAEAEEGL